MSDSQRRDDVYEVRPHSDKRGFDLIRDAVPFGRLWYGEPNAIVNTISYAKFFSRSHDSVIRVYNGSGKRDRNPCRCVGPVVVASPTTAR
jgi:hypothetical protein